MAQKPVKKQKAKSEASKQTEEGFKGALPVDLDRVMDGGKTLLDELSLHVVAVLDQEITNQQPRLDSIIEWEKNYRGDKDPKSFPNTDSANTASPVSRSNTDAIYVRLAEAVRGKRRTFTIRPRTPEAVPYFQKLEDYVDWFMRHKLDFLGVIQSPMIQCVKTGTGIVKWGWVSEKRTVYRYASNEEQKDKGIHKYPIAGSSTPGIKSVITAYEGPKPYGIDRLDFLISSDACTIEDAYLVGFKFRLRLPEIKLRMRQKDSMGNPMYRKSAVEKLISPDETDPLKEGRAVLEKKEIKHVEGNKPFTLWELWLKYDVDEDGEEDDIVLTLHRETGAILRAVYNPHFYGFRPFVDLVFYPCEYSFDGQGICEILHKPQLEIDAMHNQLLDRLTQINSPILFVRSGSNLEDLEELEPGRIYVVDDELETAIREFSFSDTTYSIAAEEDKLLAQADRACGITPNVLGQSTAERPVAKETFANLQEANKKFANGIENFRKRLTKNLYMFMELHAQYQPSVKYSEKEGKGAGKKAEEWVTKNVDFPIEIIRDGFEVDLAASTELLNMEARREINITLYTLLSDYYTKTAGMVQAIIDPETPPAFKKFLVEMVKKGDARVTKILEDFDEKDADQYVINLEDIVDLESLESEQELPEPPPPEPIPEPLPGPMGPGGPEMGGPPGPMPPPPPPGMLG